MIFKLANPIPQTIRSTEQLNEVVAKWQGVPYYGTLENGSHEFLELLQTLTELSGTFSSAMEDINFYTFGNRLQARDNVVPGMDTEEVELGFEEQMDYFNWIKELGISPQRITKLSRKLNHHMEVCGNAYLFIRRVEVNGQVVYSMKVIHYKHFMYRYTKDHAIDECLISKFLNDKTLLEKHPPKIMKVSTDPEDIVWNEAEEPGVEEAVIHLKLEDEDGESDFYSRSKLIGAMTWLYIDFQLGNLNSKIAATELITKKILAFQAPDPNAMIDEEDEGQDTTEEEHEAMGIPYKKRKNSAFQNNMMELKNLVSNVSTHPTNMLDGPAANTIAGVQYPFSGQPPTEIDLEMNRDTKHQQFQVETAVAFICQCLRWAPELLSVRPTKTTLGGNLLYDIFTMKNEATIRPKALKFQDFWNTIIGEIKEREGIDSRFENYGIVFPDIIENMISRFKGSGGTANIGENPVRDQTADVTETNNGEQDVDDAPASSPV